MEDMDTVKVVTRMIVCLTVILIACLVLINCQHDTLREQMNTIDENERIIKEQDSLIECLIEERDSLQIAAGVDND